MPGFGSLGGMFSAVAAQVFDDLSEAGKEMGLAPYGAAAIPPAAGDRGPAIGAASPTVEG